MNKTLKIALGAVATLASVAVMGASPACAVVAPVQMSYVVSPHPDDEWQMWSLIENSSDNYKVFITLTRGEQSTYCAAPYTGNPPSVPNPYPNGKWSATCEEARLNSWLGFFTQMSATDPSIPGDWVAQGEKGPFPSKGVSLRVDDGAGLIQASTGARVWLDAQGRGAAVSFDLGDGDLTAAEVRWAVETVRDNRAALGINSTLPNWNVLGAFANTQYANCQIYGHADHTALHDAFWNVDFGAFYQSAASCATDPDGVRTQVVGDNATNTAWGPAGAFKTQFGWLGNYALTQSQAGSVFMRTQSFWTRFWG
jgi:hypothetical protein